MASVFNTIEVNTGRVARIVNFLSSSSEFFIAIGKSTPWEGSFGLNITDQNPPVPTINTTQLLEPILYKRIKIGITGTSIVSAASKQSHCSDYNSNQQALSSITLVEQSIAEQNFNFYAVEDIVNNDGSFSKNPEFIYIQATILDTEYVEDSWRACALYTKLFLNDGVSNNLPVYTPSQVKGGLLHHITYNTPVLRQTGKNHKFEYIINV